MTIQCLVEALSKLMDDNSGPIRLLIPEVCRSLRESSIDLLSQWIHT